MMIIIPDDVVLYIYSYLLSDADLLAASSTCKQWRGIALDDYVWKQRAAIGRMDGTKLNTRQLDTPGNWLNLYKDLVNIKFEDNLAMEAVEASSTDYDQGLSCTLRDTPSFWSSTGSPSTDDNEHAIIKLLHPLSVVRSVKLFIYKAYWQKFSPIYNPSFVTISIGFTPQTMHYTSEQFPVAKLDSCQTFELNEAQFGSYVRLDFIGKTELQLSNNMYYTVVRHIQILGTTYECLCDRAQLSSSLVCFAFKHDSFPQKVLGLLQEGKLDQFFNICQKSFYDFDYRSLLTKFCLDHSSKLTYHFALQLALIRENGSPLLNHDTIRMVLGIQDEDLVKCLSDKMVLYSLM